MRVASTDRQHLLVGVGAHDHAIGLAQASPRGTMAGTIRSVAAVVAAENDIHSVCGERSNKIVKNVIGIIDEPVRVPRRKILETGMKDSPAVADDERVKRSRRPCDRQVK